MFSFSAKAMLKDDAKKIIANKTPIDIKVFNFSPPISMIDHSSNKVSYSQMAFAQKIDKG